MHTANKINGHFVVMTFPRPIPQKPPVSRGRIEDYGTFLISAGIMTKTREACWHDIRTQNIPTTCSVCVFAHNERREGRYQNHVLSTRYRVFLTRTTRMYTCCQLPGLAYMVSYVLHGRPHFSTDGSYIHDGP